MDSIQAESLQVAIPNTFDGHGIAKAIYSELIGLGHRPVYFDLAAEIPEHCDVIFFFGPFGNFLQVPQQICSRHDSKRPVFVFWNTEGLPDPRLPRLPTDWIGMARSWAGRLSYSPVFGARRLASLPPFSTLEKRFLRFRYLGDYLYAQQQGWVDVFADISAVYADHFRQRGIPTLVAPFGSFREWYSDLKLERDIDVVWFGKRATSRRSQILNRLRLELQAHGVKLHMIDGIENPFVFGEDRTRMLNRSKITINLLRTWYDENSLRICMAAPNRSLVVSEPLLPHVPQYQAGVHYVSAPIEDMTKAILYYLEHDEERQRIVENAYQLSTQVLTFGRSIQMIMDAAIQARHRQLSAGSQEEPRWDVLASGSLTPNRSRN